MYENNSEKSGKRNMDQYALMTYYAKYLEEIRKVSNATIKHYQQALRYISKFLVEREKIKQSIYEIQSLDELNIIKEYLYMNPDFVEQDTRGHRMYSAGFNNYLKFANGEGFTNIHKKIKTMDTKIPIASKQYIVVDTWKRSSIIKKQSIESAGYKCEINPNHKTFTAKSTGKPYMEGHHALPIKYQDNFNSSLDVYANIICLCPTCHRLLHYGISTEKKNLVDKIYFERAERLAISGLKLSKMEFQRLID